MKTTLATAIALASAACLAADIKLPEPNRAGGKPLNEALAARQTHRDFSPAPLTDQELSDLLWAANGFNRPEQKKRTAPTAVNRQEVDLYVCRADGAYLWDAASNVLKQVTTKDLRGSTGRMGSPENFALVAPIALVYVIDYERQGMQQRPQDAFKYASVDCGFIGQNVYLHCASTGLHTVFLGMINPQELSKGLGLPATRVPLFAQTVGHAK
jgi:nitroreductase